MDAQGGVLKEGEGVVREVASMHVRMLMVVFFVQVCVLQVTEEYLRGGACVVSTFDVSASFGQGDDGVCKNTCSWPFVSQLGVFVG